MWPKDESLKPGMEEEMNMTAEPFAFIVQADMVHFDAHKEIFEVQDKIAVKCQCS